MQRRLVLTVLLSLGLAACGQTANPGGVPTTSPGSETSAAASATTAETAGQSAAPQPTPQFPAPPELQGAWRGLVAEDDEVTLRVQASSYTITRVIRGFAARGSGQVEVDGDEIVFSRSNLCDGDGRYRWAIEGNVLRFTPLAPDPCPRPFDGVEFSRDG
jgi:hypothetical protein